MASTNAPKATGLFQALWCTGLWRLMPFLLIYSIGLAILFPITPTLMTNGFASLAAGQPMECQDYTPQESPDACVNAHSTAVTWMSWTSFVSNSLLTFVCAPYVGHMSDVVGRRPFMLIGVSLMLLPIIILQLHIHGMVPIYWYFPASALNGVVSSFNMCLTSVADLLQQCHRATAVGYLTACFSVGILIGPLLGGYLDTSTAMWVCMALTVTALLYVAAFVPECAPGPRARCLAAAAAAAAAAADVLGPAGPGTVPAGTDAPLAYSRRAAAAAEHCGKDLDADADAEAARGVAAYGSSSSLQGPGASAPACGAASTAAAPASATSVLTGVAAGWSIIRDSGFYRRIALIWIVVSMTWEGAGELLFQYLQLQLGFQPSDQANLMVVAAISGLVIKLLLLPWMVRALGERWLLVLGLAAYGMECVGLALAPTKALALVAVAGGTFAAVCWPALVALQTSAVDPRQQGAVSGALTGVSALASGVGPLGFALVFRAFTRTDSKLPHFPGAAWYLAAGMCVVAIFVALTLPRVTPVAAVALSASDDGGAAAGSEGGGEGRAKGARARRGAAAPKEDEAAAEEGSVEEPLLGSGTRV